MGSYPSNWCPFLFLSTQYCVLKQVPRGQVKGFLRGTPLLTFLGKCILSCAAWGETSLIQGELAKSTIRCSLNGCRYGALPIKFNQFPGNGFIVVRFVDPTFISCRCWAVVCFASGRQIPQGEKHFASKEKKRPQFFFVNCIISCRATNPRPWHSSLVTLPKRAAIASMMRHSVMNLTSFIKILHG